LAEVSAIACQLLVHLVEEGYIDHPITTHAIQEYLLPLKDKNIDTVVLCCTHFPLLQRQIKQALDPAIRVIDPAKFCAESLQKLLKKKNLLNLDQKPGRYQFFVSDAPEKFRKLGNSFLGCPLEHVSLFKS
jgi:glutamate racemase